MSEESSHLRLQTRIRADRQRIARGERPMYHVRSTTTPDGALDVTIHELPIIHLFVPDHLGVPDGARGLIARTLAVDVASFDLATERAVTLKTPPGLRIRGYRPDADEPWASGLLGDGLAGRLQTRRGEIVDALEGEGLVAELDGRAVGLLTFRPDGPTTIELAALVVAEPGRGVGSALIAAFIAEARRRQARRVWVVTTNDNLDALRLYQRRGFRLVELRAGAVDRARAELKPSIGEIADNGIPIRDELELAIDL